MINAEVKSQYNRDGYVLRRGFMSVMTATMTIALAANSFGADWRAIAEASGPAWNATATGLEAKGPRYHDLPETALDGMDDKK